MKERRESKETSRVRELQLLSINPGTAVLNGTTITTSLTGL
jgi:hypothetical protein